MATSQVSAATRMLLSIRNIRFDIFNQERIIKQLLKADSEQLKDSFIEQCMQTMFSHTNTHVTVSLERLLDVTGNLEIQDMEEGFDFACNMTPDAADKSKPIDSERVFFDLAMNIANQGGFIYVGPDEKARKWEIKDSGSKAFNKLFHSLYQKQLLPGLPNSRIISPKDVDKLIGPEMVQANGKVVPFKKERLAVFKEFAQADAWTKLARILSSAKQGDGSYIFDFKSIREISNAFPVSFGQDPFYKKAALLPILFANHANTRGENVTVDGIVAADYRLPQVLHSIGILEFSPELINKLENEEIMSADDLMVIQMRAASIYVCKLLSEYLGIQINQVDAALWQSMKGGSLKRLQDETLKLATVQGKKITYKHMLVPTFRF